ncbi:MAG TPA: PxKF domain-containing protein, partial [Nitriliruptorales bacterium]
PPPTLNCQPQTAFVGGTEGSLPAVAGVPADARTLVVYNHQRLSARYGQAAVADVLAAWETALAGDTEAGPFVLVPVDGDAAVRAAYADWDADPCEPERANDVVREIVRVTDTYTVALPELRFVTILGDDDQVPSLRVPDLVTLSNQRDYYPDLVFGDFDNALSAAAGLGYVTTDGAYGDLDPIGWLGHELLVPELAVGRLVETPSDMIGALNHYDVQPYLEMDASLVSAYDFLLDGGQDTQDALVAAQSPTSAPTLFSDVWNKDDALDEIGAAPDIAAINGHFNHYQFLTAAGNCPEAENPTDPCPPVTSPSEEVATSSETLGSWLTTGAHLFTVGCNAGINVPALAAFSPSAGDTERLFDWAEAMAGIQGTLFGNSGFGYGDTELNLYSERLMTHYAGFLDGSMTLAQAAVAARHAYLGELGLPGAYDDKVITESTFYGLPFVRVGAAGAVTERHDNLALPAAEITGITLDTLSRIRSTSFSLFPTFDFVDLGRGDFWQVTGVGTSPGTTDISTQTEPLLISHYRPVQPEITLNLEPAPDGTVLGDVLITGLSSTQDDLDDPYFVRPTFDLGANEPEPLVVDAAFPASLGNINPEGNLILHPGQYRSDTATPGSGDQTLFTRIQGEVLYPDIPSDPPVRPTFTQVLATDLGSTAFIVEASPAELVLVLYKIPGQADWGSVLLNEVAPGVWSGFTPDDVEEYFVQAVNGGVVGSARGKGLDFQPFDQTFPGSGFTLELGGTLGDNGWYTSPVTVTLADSVPDNGDDDATYEASVNFAGFDPVAGDPPQLGVTPTGLSIVEARRSNGDRAAAFVAIDTIDPTAVVSPADGTLVGVGEVAFGQVSCADAGSGVATCDATLDGNTVGPGVFALDTSPGLHTIQATVTDFAGRTQTATVTYEAYVFEGFFAPVENPDVVNVVKAGSTIPIKFRLKVDDGTIVDDTAAISAVRSVWMECPTATESTTADDDPASATGSTVLRFDAESQQFVFDWRTNRLWRGCREFQVETIDGAIHRAWFKFR